MNGGFDARIALANLNKNSKRLVIFLAHYHFIVQSRDKGGLLEVDLDGPGVFELAALVVLYAGGYILSGDPIRLSIKKDDDIDLVVRTIISPFPVNLVTPGFFEQETILDELAAVLFPD